MTDHFNKDHGQHDLVDAIGAFTLSFGFILLIGIIFTVIQVVMG